MPGLSNPKHEAFARELARGTSAGKAYVIAGFAENRANAGTLSRKQHIVTRVAELHEEREETDRAALEKACDALAIDKQWVMGRLVENANRAMQAVEVKDANGGTGEYKYDGSVANRALELLGKELGMFKDKSEVKHSGGMDIAWLPVSG